MSLGYPKVNLARCTVLSSLCSGLVCLLATATAHGQQQVTVGVPNQVLSDSFYENFGIGWGFSSRPPGGNGGFFFNNGGMGGAIPAFGGFDPNAGANLGFRVGGPNGSFNFNMAAGSGSSRSITSTTPMITMPNGGFGSIQSGEIRPFVTGIVPVVGDGGQPITATNPLTERLRRIQTGEQAGPRYAAQAPQRANSPAVAADSAPAESTPTNDAASGGSVANDPATSTAQRGDLSVKELREQRASADQVATRELAELVAKAEAAEAEGKRTVARIYFQQAQRRATGAQARELADRANRLK